MARIRSLHPAIFTDERYMALTFPARELIKGLWCEADDQGVFEWKLFTLKARILPADPVDIMALLAELVAGQFVAQFQHAGRDYGAIRNFRRFQRPKKPNSIHFLPAKWRPYVGLAKANGVMHDDECDEVPHWFRTGPELVPN